MVSSSGYPVRLDTFDFETEAAAGCLIGDLVTDGCAQQRQANWRRWRRQYVATDFVFRCGYEKFQLVAVIVFCGDDGAHLDDAGIGRFANLRILKDVAELTNPRLHHALAFFAAS